MGVPATAWSAGTVADVLRKHDWDTVIGTIGFDDKGEITKRGTVVSVTRSMGWLAVIASAWASQSLAVQVTCETNPRDKCMIPPRC